MAELKIGMIGLDTSHCPSFTKLLNDPQNPHHVPGGRVVCAFPGGSQACAVSRTRVAQFTAQFRDEFKIEILDSIEAVCQKVDAVLLESVDGRQHLEQFEKIARYGRPVFIDKPFTCSVKDAKQILRLSKKTKSPVFTASSIRFAKGIAELGAGAKVMACQAFGPAAILEDYPGLFWYGIHSAEVLYSKMGRGCRELAVRKTESADAVTGVWEDGRVGMLFGTRIEGAKSFGCTLFTDKGVVHGLQQDDPPAYALLLLKIIGFFQTGTSPVDPAESAEIVAFLEAANKSRETGRPARVHA